MVEETAQRHVILTGCSGGGKSTLLDALAARGFQTVEEPGRRIVAHEMRNEGTDLPWLDAAAFAQRAVETARLDREQVSPSAEWIFFDRGLIDAAVALQHAAGIDVRRTLEGSARFCAHVFIAPPWHEIYENMRNGGMTLKRPYTNLSG